MFYNYGKNYFMALENYNLNDLNSFQFFEFLRGYIEVNSKLILPTNITNYLKNIDNIYDKYPLLIIYFKKTNTDNDILLNKLLNLFNDELNIDYKIDVKNKIFNKFRYNFIIKLENYNVLNLLSKIYPPDIDKNEIDEYLYSLYLNLSNYRYINYDIENDNLQYFIPKCKINLIHPGAIMPYKDKASDIGYNINLIQRYQMISDNIIIYNTGINITPQYGYYYKLLPYYKLSLDGYILGTYYEEKNKNLLITLIKIDKSLPDIKLPYICSVMILKEMKHFELIS